jgi:hypothetical protein
MHLHADQSEQPTVEQLAGAKMAEIHFKIVRDDKNYDQKAWEQITLLVQSLIDQCNATPNQNDDAQKLFELAAFVLVQVNKLHKNGAGFRSTLDVQVEKADQN